MTDRKEVISHFQDAIKTMSWDLSYWMLVRTDIVKDAIALLQKQESVKPIRLENWWKCPFCSGNIVANMKYCPGCGRKVKWDG